MHSSGKLVILGILTVALASAAASWWFRYAATHRAAEFWGPENARLIRDAPIASLSSSRPSTTPKPRDISMAPGITHLRNALLEDRSFQWDRTIEAAPKGGGWKLTFSDAASSEWFTIHFTNDCRGAIVEDGSMRSISTEPIANGLHQVFAELLPESEAGPR